MNIQNELSIFYYCPFCENLVEMIHASGQKMICCGKEMLLLQPGTSDGKTEFHLPVCKIEDKSISVDVGVNPHPMMEEHHISWIELVTDRGVHRIKTKGCSKAHVCFHISKKETPVAVYAYCNIHGLWAIFFQK